MRGGWSIGSAERGGDPFDPLLCTVFEFEIHLNFGCRSMTVAVDHIHVIYHPLRYRRRLL